MRAERARLDVRAERAEREHDAFDVLTAQGRDGRRGAGIRHREQLRAGERVDQLDAEVADRARAGVADAHAAGLLLRVLDSSARVDKARRCARPARSACATRCRAAPGRAPRRTAPPAARSPAGRSARCSARTGSSGRPSWPAPRRWCRARRRPPGDWSRRPDVFSALAISSASSAHGDVGGIARRQRDDDVDRSIREG